MVTFTLSSVLYAERFVEAVTTYSTSKLELLPAKSDPADSVSKAVTSIEYVPEREMGFRSKA